MAPGVEFRNVSRGFRFVQAGPESIDPFATFAGSVDGEGTMAAGRDLPESVFDVRSVVGGGDAFGKGGRASLIVLCGSDECGAVAAMG